MTARRAVRLTLAVLGLVVAVSACARENPAPVPRQFELGASRVLVVVPTGWEALDQGRQKRFRKDELEIVLQDLGPSTPVGSGPGPGIGPCLLYTSPSPRDRG